MMYNAVNKVFAVGWVGNKIVNLASSLLITTNWVNKKMECNSHNSLTVQKSESVDLEDMLM